VAIVAPELDFNQPPAHHHTGLRQVMVIDSQALVRAGLVSLIETHFGPGSVCFSGSTASEALFSGQSLGGTCAVLGTRRDDPTGQEIESIAAFVMHGIDVLVLVDDPSEQSLQAAIVAGAKGYLAKTTSSQEFIQAVKLVTSGHPCLQFKNEMRNASRLPTRVQLSEQERRALVLYASGLTQVVVARRMGISPNTAKHYLDRVRDKYSNVGVRARTKLELYALARAEGLLP
jgi:two-component system, NarL family, nitrate/nitrite response regulator NarL